MSNPSKKASGWSLALSLVAGMSTVVATSIITSPALAEDERVLEEVVVTGSRIKRDPGTYVGPMTILTGESVTEHATSVRKVPVGTILMVVEAPIFPEFTSWNLNAR